MPLFSSESQRDESDVTETFFYIYSELTAKHQSNEPLRVFIQYFIPLFDIALGAVVFNKEDIKPLITYPLSQKYDILSVWSSVSEFHRSSAWIDPNNLTVKSILDKYANDSYNIKSEAKSFCAIPIRITGCFRHGETSKPVFKDVVIGIIAIFSRLDKEKFVAANDFLKTVQCNITASFLEPSERRNFLSGRSHKKCIHKGMKKACRGNGIGPLNKMGILICNWYEGL